MSGKAAASEKVTSFDIEAKQFDEENGDLRFEGWLVRYGNTDSDGDIIQQGAFADSVRSIPFGRRPFPVLFQHQMAEQIGIFESLDDRPEGVFVKGIIGGKLGGQADRVISLMRKGWLNSLSVGFEVLKQKFNGATRIIELGKMWEGSVVTIPANEDAGITSIKQFKAVCDSFYGKSRVERLTSDDLRELPLSEIEKRLAERDVSRHGAKMLAAGLSRLRDEDETSNKRRDGVSPEESKLLKEIGENASLITQVIQRR